MSGSKGSVMRRAQRAARERLCLAVGILLVCGAASAADLEFSRDIRPILSNACFDCHGPDAGTREADLRLDTQEGAFAPRDGQPAFVPGKPAESEALRRILSTDPDEQMPPPTAKRKLTEAQIALLREWVEQGARWSTHWSYNPPVRPDVPETKQPDSVRNAIDRFVQARLEREGLAPAPEADRVTLLRRLSLDLIGLPPTIEEVDAFVADDRPDAYERQVDRLLASPHYGERWGRHWLDAARYADSDGYEKDKPRQVWFYRDWVTGALNRDLPYDQFVIEQLAGDLLPHPTQDQLVATGFLRNSMVNEEGGIDPEQFRMEAMFDRMDAIGKSILGLTIQCAQCHSHKYDPLTQEEYYRLFAFLNNDHEANIASYTPVEQMRRAEIFRRIHELEAELQHRHPDWAERMARWEDSVSGQIEWTVVQPEEDLSGGQKHYLLDDGSILAQGYAPSKHTSTFDVETTADTVTGFRLELMNDPNLPLGGPGRSIYGACALSEIEVTAAPLKAPEKSSKVKLVRATADINPPEAPLDPKFDDKSDKKRVVGPVEMAIDGKQETAWTNDLGPGRHNAPCKAVFVPAEPLHHPGGMRLTFRLVQVHGGWNSNDNQNNNLGRFRFAVTSAAEPAADPVPVRVRKILSIPRDKRTPAQTAAVFRYWRTTVPEWQAVNDEIEAQWRQHPAGASQLVLQHRDEPRTTSVLERGNFLKPTRPVEPGVPAFLQPLPKDAPPTRLTFARWLVDRNAPTTPRAIVNRVWQAYFGIGLVSTSEDLGSQSEAPSHPQLLDWLSVEFMDRGWSLKNLHRLIVTSATYRQSSAVSPELQTRDPYNRLLARGPRVRVEAEIVRDIALAASGLLSEQIGGPSVYPPAPEFLFLPPASYGTKVWDVAQGPDRYRRATYTFQYRSVPFPALQTFDAPNGDFSCVRRARSNTPLQALTTLNEPLFVECAQHLASVTLRHGGTGDVDRLTYAFRRCLSRAPEAEELAVLRDLLEKERRHRGTAEQAGAQTAQTGNAQAGNVQAGNAQVASVGAVAAAAAESAAPADELAAWTVVARVLLNLDETITKE